MSGSVCNAAASVSLSSLAVFKGLSAESALVDLSLGSSREGHAIVLELDDGLGRHLGHVVDGVLVAQPIGALDRVVHVVLPVVVLHISQSGIDTALGSNGVGTGGEELGNAGGLETGLGKAKSGSESGTSGTNNNCIILVVNGLVCVGNDLEFEIIFPKKKFSENFMILENLQISSSLPPDGPANTGHVAKYVPTYAFSSKALLKLENRFNFSLSNEVNGSSAGIIYFEEQNRRGSNDYVIAVDDAFFVF